MDVKIIKFVRQARNFIYGFFSDKFNTEFGVCNSCDFEGSGFRARIGSDLHFDGAPIDADAPLSGWLECPECQHLSCS